MTGKKLDVLFLASWYPSRVNALLGIFVKRHAEAVARYCNVSVICVSSDDKDEVVESNEEGIYTIRVYYKKVSSSIPIYSQWKKWRRYLKECKKAAELYKAKRGKPDIINSNVVFPVTALALRLKKKWNVPYVVTEHWTGYFPEDGRYKASKLQRVWKRAIAGASAVITVSESLKNQMLSLGLKNKYFVIPNVVDGKVFSISKSNSGPEFNFVHVSGLDDAQKNVSGIISTFEKVSKQVKDISLTIVGDSPGLNKLKGLAKNTSVTFTGSKTGKELVEVLNRSNAFVLFSNYENLPCVMLEAMCCGLPVIATRAGDIPLYINSGNGILVDAGNEEQLAEAMENIIMKRKEYNTEIIRAAVIDKVDAGAIGKLFLDVYNKVLNK